MRQRACGDAWVPDAPASAAPQLMRDSLGSDPTLHRLMATYRTELLRQAVEMVASTPTLRQEWRTEQARAILFIPADTPTGFDVTLSAGDADFELRAGRFHWPFDDNPNPEQSIRHALGLVRDLLSPAMRLRELLAGRVPYRWFLEARQHDRWVPEHETGLLFWPYWAPRSDRVFVNHHFPART